MRQERNSSYLPIKLGRPSAGQHRATPGTASFGGQMVVLDEIAVALDQRLAAVVTMCVFQISNQSGEITRVDVAKPRFFSNLDRKSTRLNSSHLVISYAVF